ncbi:serine/threonine-protein kinase ATG1c-like [Gossypium australe]|uniref:Serine/threonine-protein kinase ATG1c-like n=1 Tax=Gossypium australe TaxID=47621 RepID=A0A5B6V412_9ROSI|nr:serine/threonine-protein kinase ATG1c-like [Gossypium australe]
MAQPTGRGRVVGDYLVGRQIGSGSFSIVWHARHRVHGTEVAIKEIVTSRLNKKLQDSLMSEIFILKRINHPNIIRLHDIIEVPGKIHLVLEYCKGGDLSMYVTRYGSVPEATAKHFMQQLAAGLLVLRDNNLIHRDLKPQNLLLSTNDSNAVLKIADFGFARSLQPRGLAETLCGSPLYMAPEIMQLQKYDAKIFGVLVLFCFSLLLGKLHSLETIKYKLNELLTFLFVSNYLLGFLNSDCKDLCQKLLRRNPVERLTFEEFFNHPFLSEGQPDKSLRSQRFPRAGFPLSESGAVRNTEESFQEDCLPFFLDDDSSGPDGSPSFAKKRSSMKSAYGFSADAKDAREATSSPVNRVDFTSKYSGARQKLEDASFRLESCKVSSEALHEPHKSMDQRSVNTLSRESLELIDQDYVLVSGPPLDVSSSSVTSKPNHIPYKSENPPLIPFVNKTASTAPMPIIGPSNVKICHARSLDSQSSAPETSQGSMDIGDALEQPSSHCLTRIKSLQHCASTITELVHEKIEAGRQLEAFSIQLVILAIWKQALHICHTQAASGTEGSPSREASRLGASRKHETSDTEECKNVVSPEGPEDISSEIEREFLREVEHAEELAKVIEPGNTEMPDAMETIFQAALALGRHGGVDELMGDMESAALLYSKAERLLVFLLVEAPSLILNPPFSLTNSDRYRLRTYIDFLRNRQGYSRSQMTDLLKCKDQP